MSHSQNKLSRRTLFAGAGAAGAVGLAAGLVPAVRETAQLSQALKEPPAKGGGYQLTEHVKQYYKTTLI